MEVCFRDDRKGEGLFLLGKIREASPGEVTPDSSRGRSVPAGDSTDGPREWARA